MAAENRHSAADALLGLVSEAGEPVPCDPEGIPHAPAWLAGALEQAWNEGFDRGRDPWNWPRDKERARAENPYRRLSDGCRACGDDYPCAWHEEHPLVALPPAQGGVHRG